MTSLPVDEGCADVWVTPARAVDHGRDDTAPRWTPGGAHGATGAGLWAAVDGCGSRATTLTRRDARSSTIHRHPYFYDLDVIPAVGECSPRPEAPRHPQRPAARRESEHRR
jgi:hypothetical protein